MIRCLFLLTFALLAGRVFSQNDTADIDALNLRSEELYSTDVEKSMELSRKALKLSKAIDYRSGEAFAYLNLAVANDIKGNSKIATNYFHRAIYLFKLTNDKENLSFCYSQLGVCYFAQYQYESSDWNYRKAIELCKELHLEVDLADVLVNQGITFTYQDRPREAEKNFKKAIEIYNKYDYEVGLGPAYNSLAKIYYDEGDLKKATRYFKYAVTIAKKYDSDYNLISSYNAVANCYLDMKQYHEAESYALKGLELAKETGAKEREMYVHQTLAEIYSGLGEYQKAYKSLSDYSAIKDEIFTEEQSDALVEMQARFEVKANRQKVREIKLTQQIQKENHFWQLVILAGVIFIVLLVSVFLFFLFRNKKRINALLEQKYEMTRSSLEQKDFMMGEIHHRVKNNLQMIHAILDLQARDLKDPESVALIEDSLNRINAISMIHKKLYQSENIRAVRIDSYLNELVSDLIHHFTHEAGQRIDLVSECEDLNLDIETALPLGLIVAELVTNSCKYAFDGQADAQIRLELKEQEEQLLVSVSDNGKGKPATGSAGNFGTKLIRSLSRKLKAELTETSSEDGLITVLVIKNYKVYHD